MSRILAHPILACAILCSASLSSIAASPIADEPPILISLRVIQIDQDQLSGEDLDQGIAALSYSGVPAGFRGELPEGHAPVPDAVAELTLTTQSADGSSTVLKTPAMGMGFVFNGSAIKLGERTCPVSDSSMNLPEPGASDSPSPAGSPTADPAFKVLTAPRLLVNPGQQAELTVGRPVTYLEPTADGLFRALDLQESFEGLTFKTVANHDAEGRVVLSSLDLTLSEVSSRLPVPGLNLDAGRPLMRTAEVTATMTLPDGMAAVVPFMDGGARPKLRLLVLISAKDAKGEPGAR